MNDTSSQLSELRHKFDRFVAEEIVPSEAAYNAQHAASKDRWHPPPMLDELKAKAKAAGLWNLFLPESEHGVVKQYYRDLFAGRLGFQLVKTFKTYPSLFGVTINDDSAEWTFRLFDHPGVYIFRRQ